MNEIYKKNIDERCGSFMDSMQAEAKEIKKENTDYYSSAMHYSIDMHNCSDTLRFKD